LATQQPREKTASGTRPVKEAEFFFGTACTIRIQLQAAPYQWKLPLAGGGAAASETQGK